MTNHFENLISIENLFQAWLEFRKGKRSKSDVQVFERNLEDNVFYLHERLKDGTYKHSSYQSFYVNDPKRRHIHKASVVDRVVHHLLYRYLYGIFDRTFIFDSYSCRIDKGTHRGVKKLEYYARKVSKNYKYDCWALKGDVKKFFANVDHQILLNILKKRIKNKDIIRLLQEIIESFSSGFGKNKGIPLGNLTSQIFANIYLNELDQFIKHKLKIRFYLRYADDFLLVSENKKFLISLVEPIKEFLSATLKFELHPDKIIIKKLKWGIDFLGYIVLPHYILPRTKTKRRIFEKINSKNLQSYLGFLKHANTHKLVIKLLNDKKLN